MANDTPQPVASSMEDASVYLDYESYSFEVSTWEELDPKTFNISTPSGDKMSWFDKYINYKIKFFAYLNFFAADPEISGIRSNFQGKYDMALKSLDEETILKSFVNENSYTAKENEFLKTLSGNTKETYEFFKKHYDTFFNKIGNGFFINVKKERLIESGVVKEGDKTAKKITPWNSRTDNYINKAIRAFPLLYYSPKNNGALAVQFVYFVDGSIRNSIDYFDNGQIHRVYLPVLDANSLTIDAVVKDRMVPTFTANSNAINEYLKRIDNYPPSLLFNPDIKPFETKLTLETVDTNRDLRGCSIY